MTIKQVGEQYGISPDTLRYYEKVGIIRPVPKKNGIRQYGDKELANIEFVTCMRSAGVAVETLVEYIKLFDQGDRTADARRQLLLAEREKLQAKLAAMQAAYEKLNYKIDVYYSHILAREKELLPPKD